MQSVTPMSRLARPVLRRSVLASALLATAACTVRPAPISREEAAADAAAARRDMFSGQEPITGLLSLESALARALRYNLDARVAMLEQATQVSQLNLLHYEMLPRLTANAGYFARNRDYVSSSYSRVTNQTFNQQTISQDRLRWTADLTLSWNLLDFGTSYYQARQQADRILVAHERRRRAINNIFQEVTAAYWQAATAQRLLPRIERALTNAQRAAASAQRLERNREMPLVDALTYQRNILELTRQLEFVADDMRLAQARLAQLMGLPPGTTYHLAVIDTANGSVPRLMHDTEALERVALVNRPEVQEERYNIRIAQLETRRAIMRFLPNFNPFAMVAYDSNSYLYYQNWAELGFRSSLQLLNLAALPTTRELGQRLEDLAQMRRLAVSMAVVAQVHVSVQQYNRARLQFENANRMAQIERRLSALSEARGAAQSISDLERIRAVASSLAAELQRDRAYADVMNAHTSLHVALGLDPLPGDMTGQDIAVVAEQIRETRQRWANGALEIPVLPDLPVASEATSTPAAAVPAPEQGTSRG